MAERHRPPSHAQRDNWVTVSVTALAPGWRSVHSLADGTTETHPIPAMLLQELRSTTHLRASTKQDIDAVSTDGTQDDHEPPPYSTRVVIARTHGGVELTPVDGADLIGVVGPADPVIPEHGGLTGPGGTGSTGPAASR